MCVKQFLVRIELRHWGRGPRSLLPDLPDLGQRLETLTPCLLILGVWPFHDTGFVLQSLARAADSTVMKTRDRPES